MTVAEGYAAIWAGSDGTWANEKDGGPRFDREHAAALLRAQMSPEHAATGVELGEQASAAYDRAAKTLGSPERPMSRPPDYVEPLLDAALGVAAGRVADAGERVGRGALRTVTAVVDGGP